MASPGKDVKEETKEQPLRPSSSTKQPITDRTSTNKLPEKTHRHMRSMGEIQTYLENFLPNISAFSTIEAMIMKPILMICNVLYICYKLYELVNDSADNYKTKTAWYGKHFVVYVEFIGLLFLIVATSVSYLYSKPISMTVDLLSLTGNWS
eukprot:96422_1